jgi:hypothetical protein
VQSGDATILQEKCMGNRIALHSIAAQRIDIESQSGKNGLSSFSQLAFVSAKMYG